MAPYPTLPSLFTLPSHSALPSPVLPLLLATLPCHSVFPTLIFPPLALPMRSPSTLNLAIALLPAVAHSVAGIQGGVLALRSRPPTQQRLQRRVEPGPAGVCSLSPSAAGAASTGMAGSRGFCCSTAGAGLGRARLDAQVAGMAGSGGFCWNGAGAGMAGAGACSCSTAGGDLG